MSQCEWRQVVSGDIVRVVRDQSFPCDIVLLASSLEDSVCYVETKNLDGETNLKIKRGVEGTGRAPARTSGASCPRAAPTSSASTRTTRCIRSRGTSTCRGRWLTARRRTTTGQGGATKKIPVVPANVLLRGSCLRNTEWVVGVAIYAGHDTKVMMNSSAAPSTFADRACMDTVVLMMLGLLFLMGTVTAIVCGLWIKDESPKVLPAHGRGGHGVRPQEHRQVGIVAFLTSYVLYGYLIPISLYVSLSSSR